MDENASYSTPFDCMVDWVDGVDPPKFISRNKLARREWRRCEPALRQRGLFRWEPDAASINRAFVAWIALGEYCRIYAALCRERRRISYLRRHRIPVPRWLTQSERELVSFAIHRAEDNLELATTAVNDGGKYATIVKQGRPYQCPACKGTGIRPLPKGEIARPNESNVGASSGKLGHRPCSICTSPRRAEIDAALVRGDSLRSVAVAFATTKDASARHKRDHLGRPQRPVLLVPGDRTCLGCAGRGMVIPETREDTVKRPETTDQRYAIDQVAKLSAQLGLDVTSRVRVKGKPGERRTASAVDRLRERGGLRK